MSIDEPTSEAPLPSLLDPVILDDPFDTYAEMHSRYPEDKKGGPIFTAPSGDIPREINTAELGQTLEAMFRYVDGWCTQIEVAVDESH